MDDGRRFRAEVTEANGRPLVELAGDIDLAACGDLVDVLAAHPLAIVRLSRVTFCDSSGLRTLILAARGGATIQLADASPAVQRVVELTDTTSLFSTENPPSPEP